MKKGPFTFYPTLSPENRKNRHWQEAVDSPFSDLFGGFSLSTKIFIGAVGLICLGGAIFGTKSVHDYFQKKRQEAVALRAEALRSHLEKVLTNVMHGSKLSMTADEKRGELKKIKDSLMGFAKQHSKNVYAYESALLLAKLYVDEAIALYDERALEEPTAQELSIQRMEELKTFPEDMRRAYAMLPRSAEHNAYSNAAQWLRWSIDHAPSQATRFIAQERLVRVLWEMRLFSDASELLEEMDQTGDRKMRVHELKAKFFKMNHRNRDALKEYESALSELDRNIKLLGEDGLSESTKEALKLKRTFFECNIAALQAQDKVVSFLNIDKAVPLDDAFDAKIES